MNTPTANTIPAPSGSLLRQEDIRAFEPLPVSQWDQCAPNSERTCLTATLANSKSEFASMVMQFVVRPKKIDDWEIDGWFNREEFGERRYVSTRLYVTPKKDWNADKVFQSVPGDPLKFCLTVNGSRLGKTFAQHQLFKTMSKNYNVWRSSPGSLHRWYLKDINTGTVAFDDRNAACVVPEESLSRAVAAICRYETSPTFVVKWEVAPPKTYRVSCCAAGSNSEWVVGDVRHEYDRRIDQFKWKLNRWVSRGLLGGAYEGTPEAAKLTEQQARDVVKELGRLYLVTVVPPLPAVEVKAPVQSIPAVNATPEPVKSAPLCWTYCVVLKARNGIKGNFNTYYVKSHIPGVTPKTELSSDPKQAAKFSLVESADIAQCLSKCPFVEAGSVRYVKSDIIAGLKPVEKLSTKRLTPEAADKKKLFVARSRQRLRRLVDELVEREYDALRARNADAYRAARQDESKVWVALTEAVKDYRVITKHGLLYRNGVMMEIGEADREAEARGFPCAERLVAHLENLELVASREIMYTSAVETKRSP